LYHPLVIKYLHFITPCLSILKKRVSSQEISFLLRKWGPRNMMCLLIFRRDFIKYLQFPKFAPGKFFPREKALLLFPNNPGPFPTILAKFFLTRGNWSKIAPTFLEPPLGVPKNIKLLLKFLNVHPNTYRGKIRPKNWARQPRYLFKEGPICPRITFSHPHYKF